MSGYITSAKSDCMELQLPTATAALRVLHITASSTIGGGPEHVWQLVRHLPHEVESFIAAPVCEPYGSRFMETVGAERICPLPHRKFSLMALWRLVQFIHCNRIDVIHSHGKGAGVYGRIAALFTRTASVHTFHGIHLPPLSLKRYAYMAMERLLCAISKACLAVSPGEADIAKQWKFGAQKLMTIPNGVNIPETLTELEMPSPFLLVHVSRFDPIKNSLWLVDLAHALKQAGLLEKCLFVLIGDGEELPELQNRIKNDGLGAAFQILGSQPTVRPFLQNAGCLISTSRREGLPLALLEAQAEGVPVLASDVVGNRDCVRHEWSGFLYPLDNLTSAVMYIQKLMATPLLWKKMRRNAYQMAKENFRVESMAAATARCYTSIALHPKQSRGLAG